jgi:hypothetical protein
MSNALRSLVPLAHVASVRQSIAFYSKLGFEVGNTHTPDGQEEPVWAWLRSGGAHLMVSKREAGGSHAQSVLFYVYVDDVKGFREGLVHAGVDVGPIEYPFWAPGGEFRVEDPDGYVLMITHT